jgi:hypothetical protein
MKGTKAKPGYYLGIDWGEKPGDYSAVALTRQNPDGTLVFVDHFASLHSGEVQDKIDLWGQKYRPNVQAFQEGERQDRPN